mmetsp:Transcript_43881/g.137778  ORF Transcript_43881/g.137778 Transcript_43881/m.137778 type:complete len:280 (-) Transcript_43881:679-1518(-)
MPLPPPPAGAMPPSPAKLWRERPHPPTSGSLRQGVARAVKLEFPLLAELAQEVSELGLGLRVLGVRHEGLQRVVDAAQGQRWVACQYDLHEGLTDLELRGAAGVPAAAPAGPGGRLPRRVLRVLVEVVGARALHGGERLLHAERARADLPQHALGHPEAEALADQSLRQVHLRRHLLQAQPRRGGGGGRSRGRRVGARGPVREAGENGVVHRRDDHGDGAVRKLHRHLHEPVHTLPLQAAPGPRLRIRSTVLRQGLLQRGRQPEVGVVRFGQRGGPVVL